MTPDNHTNENGTVRHEATDDEAAEIERDVDAVEDRMITDLHHLEKFARMQKEAVYLCHQRDNRVANAAPDYYIVEKYAADLVNNHIT